MEAVDSPTKLVEALQTTPFFQGLDLQVLAELAQHARLHTFVPGAVIFLEGDPAPGFYYVQQGLVKIVKMSPEGREQILYLWGAGDLFGGIRIGGVPLGVVKVCDAVHLRTIGQ